MASFTDYSPFAPEAVRAEQLSAFLRVLLRNGYYDAFHAESLRSMLYFLDYSVQSIQRLRAFELSGPQAVTQEDLRHAHCLFTGYAACGMLLPESLDAVEEQLRQDIALLSQALDGRVRRRDEPRLRLLAGFFAWFAEEVR